MEKRTKRTIGQNVQMDIMDVRTYKDGKNDKIDKCTNGLNRGI